MFFCLIKIVLLSYKKVLLSSKDVLVSNKKNGSLLYIKNEILWI